MNEIDLRDSRAEDVQPQGFVPSHLAEPMLRDRDARTTALEYTATTLGKVRVAADILASAVEDDEDPEMRPRLAAMMSTEVGRLQRLVKALATGALLLALVTVALVAGPSSGRAEAATVAPASAAMEAPTPDPAATYRVVLGAQPTLVNVRATVYTAVSPGLYCASVWSARGFLARYCSTSPTFTVPVSIDPRAFPVGKTSAQVVDDGTDIAVANIVFDARRPSRFGTGTYLDLGRGDLGVRVPVTLYSPALGRWVPQVQSPVQVQELTRRGWRVRATLTTNPPGLAVGVVHLGGGRHIIRAVRPDGATVFGTTGRNRLVVVTTEPLDIV